MWKKIVSVVGVVMFLFALFAVNFHTLCGVIGWPFTWNNAFACFCLLGVATVWLIFVIGLGVFLGKSIYASDEDEKAPPYAWEVSFGEGKPITLEYRPRKKVDASDTPEVEKESSPEG